MTQHKKNVLVITALSIITLLLSVIFVKNFPTLPVVSDSEDYQTIAVSILAKHTYPSIPNQTLLIYPPFYPLFVTIIYALTQIGSHISIYFIQYLLVGLTSILLFVTLRKYANIKLIPSVLGALCILFWPYLILYSQLISSEVLYTFLLMLFFFLFFSIRKESKCWIIIVTGIILGCVILTRPVALLLFPWILIGLFIISKLPKIFSIQEIPWKKYLMVLVISIATLLPWEIYIHKHYDRIIPVASNLGNVFSKANKTFAYLPDVEKPSILKAKVKNLYLFWDPGAGGYHLDILKEKYPVAGVAVHTYKIIFFAIVIMAGISAVICRRNRLVIYSLLIITYTWGVHTVLFPFPRYTLPIMPFVIIVAVIGITYFYDRFSKKNESTSSNTVS